jgi:ribosomal protein L44E
MKQNNSQQARSNSVQGGEGKPLMHKDCKGTHRTLLTSPADVKQLKEEIKGE